MCMAHERNGSITSPHAEFPSFWQLSIVSVLKLLSMQQLLYVVSVDHRFLRHIHREI